LTARLDAALAELYRRGFRRFISGGAMGWDLLCAERVLALRSSHPDARLIMALPCQKQTRGWPAKEKSRHAAVCAAADRCVILSGTYYTGCMMVRNRYMVDRSSFCLCYLTQMKGGTLSTVRYALEEGLPLLNTAIEADCDAFAAEDG